MKRFVLLILLLASPKAVAELRIAGELLQPAYKLVDLKAEGAPADAAIIWDVYPEEPADIREFGGRILFTAPPGVYKIKLRSIKGSAVETARATVTIGKAPTPPEPGPTPEPKPPEPPPTPTPIPEAGFRVLIVRESGATLPPAQINAMTARAVREYLDTRCVKVDGVPEWRNWDFDDDTSGESATWQNAMKRAKDKRLGKGPWLLISNGKSGYEGHFPADTAAFLQLLKTYGGD